MKMLLLLPVWMVAAAAGPRFDEWQALESAEGGFSVSLPAAPKQTERTLRPLPDQEVTVHLFTSPAHEGRALFMIGYHDLQVLPEGEEKIKDVLDGGVKGSVLNALAELTRHERIALGRCPGRHFEYIGARFGQKIAAVSRLYLVDRRIYQLTVLRVPELDLSAETEKFFASFRVIAAEAEGSSAGGVAPDSSAAPGGGGEAPAVSDGAGRRP